MSEDITFLRSHLLSELDQLISIHMKLQTLMEGIKRQLKDKSLIKKIPPSVLDELNKVMLENYGSAINFLVKTKELIIKF